MYVWTQAEIDYLIANYGNQNARQIGKRLRRSQYAVHAMRKRLGLKMTKAQRSTACSVQHANQKGHRNHNWKGGVSKNHARYIGRYKIANPEKVRAHIAVHAAVKRGHLTRKPCEICGESKVQAHHDDYTKPLSVRWLCKTHHIEADNARRQKESTSGRSIDDSKAEAPALEGRGVDQSRERIGSDGPAGGRRMGRTARNRRHAESH